MKEKLDQAIQENIGKRIQDYRMGTNLTQEMLSALVGVNANHISRIECGRGSYQLAVLYKIASALNRPLSDIVPMSENTQVCSLTNELDFVYNRLSTSKKKFIINFALWLSQQPDLP